MSAIFNFREQLTEYLLNFQIIQYEFALWYLEIE